MKVFIERNADGEKQIMTSDHTFQSAQEFLIMLENNCKACGYNTEMLCNGTVLNVDYQTRFFQYSIRPVLA